MFVPGPAPSALDPTPSGGGGEDLVLRLLMALLGAAGGPEGSVLGFPGGTQPGPRHDPPGAGGGLGFSGPPVAEPPDMRHILKLLLGGGSGAGRGSVVTLSPSGAGGGIGGGIGGGRG